VTTAGAKRQKRPKVAIEILLKCALHQMLNLYKQKTNSASQSNIVGYQLDQRNDQEKPS
jgi:hypothetical protein